MENTVSSNSSPREMNKIRIFRVEDNAFFRQILRESLQTSFSTIAIDEVADGAEAALQCGADCFVVKTSLSRIRLGEWK
jgi:CheY-like chemotaxis protein